MISNRIGELAGDVIDYSQELATLAVRRVISKICPRD